MTSNNNPRLSQDRNNIQQNLDNTSAQLVSNIDVTSQHQQTGDQIIAKPFIQRPKRIFISNLNSTIGTALVEQFRNDHIDFEQRKQEGLAGPYLPTQIVGTLSRQQNAPVPNGVTKVIKRDRTQLMKRIWVSVDTVVYDLNTSDFDQVEFAMNTIKHSLQIGAAVQQEQQYAKTLILITSPMTWASTPLHNLSKKNSAEKDANNESDDEDNQTDGQKYQEDLVYQATQQYFEEDQVPLDLQSQQSEEQDNNNAEKDQNADQQKDPDAPQDEKQEQPKQQNQQASNEGEQHSEDKPPRTPPKPKQRKVKYKMFTQDEFHIRQCPPKYQQMKMLENKALSILKSSAGQFLKVYVVCSGFLYGNGEVNFLPYFKKAWMGEQSLSVYGNGGGFNYLPTIHVNDLAKFVYNVVSYQPSKPYLIAVDQSKEPTQKSIVQTIAKKLGNGSVIENTNYSGDSGGAAQESDNMRTIQMMNLNVRFKKSAVFDDAAFGNISILVQNDGKQKLQQSAVAPAAGDSVDDSVNYPVNGAPQFQWHCKQGINTDTIDKIVAEFNLYRGLDSIKIFISGPPASGKTHFSQKLALRYNLAHITINSVIKEAQSDQVMGPKLNEQIELLKDKMVEEIQSDKKKKNQPIDRNQLKPRLPEEQIRQLIEWKLSQNMCKNRGYVLDGYPRCFDDATGLWLEEVKLKVDKPEEGEVPEQQKKQEGQQLNQNDEEEQFKTVYKYKNKMMPQHVFVFGAGEQFLRTRVKDLNQEVLNSNPHWNDDGMNRRIKAYKDYNETEGKQSLKDFFDPQKIEDFSIQQNGECFTAVVQLKIDQNQDQAQQNEQKEAQRLNLDGDQVKIWEYILKSVEKNGEPYNFKGFNSIHSQIQNMQMQRVPAAGDDLFEKNQQDGGGFGQQQDSKQKQQDDELSSDDQLIGAQKYSQDQLKKIKEKELELLDQRSQPIRQYLMTFVVPHLTGGLIEICKDQSQDPIPTLVSQHFILIKDLDQIPQIKWIETITVQIINYYGVIIKEAFKKKPTIRRRCSEVKLQ